MELRAGRWGRGLSEVGRCPFRSPKPRSLLKRDTSHTLEEGARAGGEGCIPVGRVGRGGETGSAAGFIRDGFPEEVAFKLGSEGLKKERGGCQTG